MEKQRRIAYRVARYIPDGSGVVLKDPEVIAVGINRRHAEDAVNYHGVLTGMYVMDEIKSEDRAFDFLTSPERRCTLYLVGNDQDGQLLVFRYENSGPNVLKLVATL